MYIYKRGGGLLILASHKIFLMDAETTWPKMMIMQEKKKDVQIQAMWFAAGTAAAMACLQRAVLVSVMEQWRMLVFLALNLLLLAILFTSTSTHNSNNTINSTSSTDGGSSISIESEVDEEKKWKKQTGLSVPSVSADPPPAEDERREDGSRSKDRRADSELLMCRSNKAENVAPIITNEREFHNLKNDEGEAHPQDQDQELSMDELNRRAEAFIAMFRQHLLSDAKVANSCRLHHPYSHAKGGAQRLV